MKKYLALFSMTFAAIMGLLALSQYTKEKSINVSLTQIIPSKAESTIMCSGKIEYAEVKNVYADNPSFVENIMIETGQEVKQSSTLFKISGAIEGINMNPSPNQQEINDINNFSNLYEAYSSIVKENKIDKNTLLKKNYVSNGKFSEIKSPCKGIVSSVPIKIGDFIDKGGLLCSIANNSKLQVTTNINESQISNVKVGQKVIISGIGFKDSEYTGHVEKISEEATQIVNPLGQETVVQVTIAIDSVTENVKPGFTAKCKIITEESENIIIVPYESIQTDKKGREFVYVFSENVAKKTFITTGKEFENGVEITSGLNFEDQVVADPENVFHGERLSPIENQIEEE